MNAAANWGRQQGNVLLNELLVDVAVRIQLSPTMHEKAVEHYAAIHRYLDRDGSPLKGRVSLFYPQGSMAIGATIRSADDEDQFDIDLIAEIDRQGQSPGEVLDLLFDALNGEPGSRYHGCVERQSRCVTVYYADMHLDVSPMFRNPSWTERGGHICHAKAEQPPAYHQYVPANPWGFAHWFEVKTPADQWFRSLVLEKALAYDGRVVAKAQAAPVPEHEDIQAKSLVVVALQLTKRWNRINHDRNGGQGRCIPSVVLAMMFGTNAGRTTNLADELVFQAKALRQELTRADAAGALIDLRNPMLPEDHLTDRWPGTLGVQRKYIQDLNQFIVALDKGRATESVVELQQILVGLFGERTAKGVVEDFYKRGGRVLAEGASKVLAGSGIAIAGVASAQAAPTVQSPPHKFWGD